MTDMQDPTKFGIHDGYRVREYPNSGSSGFITGYSRLCDACAHEHRHGQASRHNTAPGTQCESRNHESNVLLANSGAEEPTEYEQYKDHPDVRGWAKDDFSGRGNEVALCSSCAEDKRSAGHDMEPYYPLTGNRLMPGDSCTDCGHDLASGRKDAARHQAISAEEESRLTNLEPLDLGQTVTSRCSRCGATLAPGEAGTCPACESDSGGRKQRQRQRMVQTRGVRMEHTGMLAVLDRIWTEARFGSYGRDAREEVEQKHQNYRGRSGYVPVANNTWVHKDTDGNTHVRHHNTDIVSFRPNGDITVDTGGWDSQTTKTRINALLPNNMKLMRNPSKAQGAPERVIAHNPSGDSIYPEHHWSDEGWSRETEPTRGKYGLHRDTVLHPYEDGFTINHHSGEVHDNAVEAGEMAAPPRARGFNPDNPRPGAPRPSRNYYDTGTDYTPRVPPGLRGPGHPHYDPQVDRPYTPPTPMHEQESTHEQITRQLQDVDRRAPGGHDYGDQAPMGFSHHDMPGEGESFSDWLDRTTTKPENVKCPTCKGKGDVRATTPVPEGVNPWEHKEPCHNCGGKGLVANARLSKEGHLVGYEALSRRYLWGLQVLAYGPKKEFSMQTQAYGEVKAPVAVDTLREDACPVCGENDAYDGDQCQVCGFVTPPKMFQDPDLEKAKLLDLRGDPASGTPNDQDPNIGQNLPPVDPNAVDEEGEIPGEEGEEAEPGEEGEVDPGAEGEEAGNIPDEGGVVEGDVEGLDEEGETAEEEEGDSDQSNQVGEPIEPEDVDEDGEPPGEEEAEEGEGGPEDPEAANTHFDQGGEPFTQGPNAPTPGEPMEPGEQIDGEEVQGEEGGGMPGTPGDQVPDLLCPACGFGADAAHPTSTPGNAAAPSDAGDGMLAGDVCPNCQEATLMSVGEVNEMEEQLQGAV